MNKIFEKARTLVLSRTATDTYILFGGNLMSAFTGFLFALIAARALSVADFGIFSAVNNLMYILVSLSDVGISAGVVHFVAKLESQGEHRDALKFIKTAFLLRLTFIFLIILPLFLFPQFFASKFLATENPQLSYWVGVLCIGFIFYSLLPYIFQAKKKFLISAVLDNSLGIIRLIATIAFIFLGGLNITLLLASMMISTLGPIIIGFSFLGLAFLFVKVNKDVILRLFRFSGWIGVNNIISAISGRIDVQMLAMLLGATATGLYAIPIRLATFIVILTGSFSAVLAPRFASFGDREKEKIYIKKASMFLLPMIVGIFFWIVIARPFILVLFGDKYAESVNIFRMLAIAEIPFLLTAPAVAAIIYALKKTVYVGLFSFIQVGSLFILNLFFIPQYGVYGPAITLFIVNSLLAIYMWVIVIRNYRNV